jgi:hypothetical protein
MKARVTKEGVVIPKRLLRDVEEVDIRREGNVVILIPRNRRDPIYRLGVNPVACNAPDASEDLDKYL